jgi:arsenate reductase
MDLPRMFGYSGCGTCRKARAWLREQGVECEDVPIRERPPGAADLGRLLAAYGGNRRAILNTSGGDYRVPGVKEELAGLSEPDFLQRLSQQGNLIKRPVLIGESLALVGFSQPEWQRALGVER